MFFIDNIDKRYEVSFIMIWLMYIGYAIIINVSLRPEILMLIISTYNKINNKLLYFTSYIVNYTA
jgi:hypothetical protein